MTEKQVNKLCDTKRAYDNTQFQDWLLQENTQSTPDQELLIKQRYLDMIRRELNKVEHTAEKQSIRPMKKEEKRHRDNIRRKLSLRRQIEQEWKMKEMLLLTKIGEEVKREARVEEQRRKVREAAHQKKQALLEKKIAYHLRKMQRNDLQREGSEGSIFEDKGEDETKAPYPKVKKPSATASHRKLHQGQKRPSHHLFSSVKIPNKASLTSLPSQHNVRRNTTEQKKDRRMIRTSYSLNDRETTGTSLQAPDVSAKTANVYRHTPRHISNREVTDADLNGKKAKKTTVTFHEIIPSHNSSTERQNYYQNRCQEKVCTMKFTDKATYF
ncbi:fibrous sheath-interacting protein 2-like isoform X1 [Camelus dromedarius]|uniref:fibrous sheath-interacting protein 2-like isoform X1 n=2 Tax=Camelus dromedarius TaxID=9838 RepID=UPI00311A59E7